MPKRKKAKRAPGYYCVNTKPATRGKRCLHKAANGKVKFVKTGNIKCPTKCRSYAKGKR